jgi:hypothetical protein
MGDRNRPDDPDTPEWLYNPECAEAGPDPGTSYEPGANKHNYLEMGSETPQQLGQYWAVLATEFELLRRNGQLDEAQRTLEEIFLALQAYRRLDMQGQCMAKKRYEEITDDFEVEDCFYSETNGAGGTTTFGGDCLCSEKYWGEDGKHSSFGVPCYDDCNWQPDLSGYSGFFLREDATQGLEVLHDPSEDQYNIDLVGSAYAMSLSPPCTSDFSQPCYLAHRQNYMSQDQLIGMMGGLALIKRYIPENAEVTTCDDTKYKPLEMAIKITTALVDRVDNSYLNRISFPGSGECCYSRATFTNAEGGQAYAVIHGLKKAADYIDGRNRHSNGGEYFAWVGLRGVVQLSYSAEGIFWLRLKALGWDMGEERNATKTLFNSAIQTQGQEIYALINNLLYPGGENLSTDQAFFAEMLCSAPCGGPCIRREPYEGQSSGDWPWFTCSNHPDWRGQRWENNRAAKTPNRLFNGLDFMALYNIYLLHYNQSPEDYFNPNRPEGGESFYADKIEGLSVLCKDQTAYYEAQPIYGSPGSTPDPSLYFEKIQWASSSNFNIFSPNANGTDIEAETEANPSYIEARVVEGHSIPLYWTDGTPRYDHYSHWDRCAFTLRKPIFTTTPDFHIYSEYDECSGTLVVFADGEDAPGAEYNWAITQNGSTTYEQGQGVDIPIDDQTGEPGSGSVHLALTVSRVCPGQVVTVEKVANYHFDCSGGIHRAVVAYPNPTKDNVSVLVTREYTVTSEGLDVLISRTDGSPQMLSRRIYSNGESGDISTLPDGLYNLQVTASDLLQPLNTSFVISR